MSDQMPDPYDRLLGVLHGLPDVISTQPSTVRTITPLLGNSSTYIAQERKERGESPAFLRLKKPEG